MKQSQTKEEMSQKRQCWECLRRRLVCDFTRPSCKKCQKAGKECPGYNENCKPLQWLEPGKTTCRRRQRKGAPSSKSTERKSTTDEASKEKAFELSALALAVTEDTEDVEDIPRAEWSKSNDFVQQVPHLAQIVDLACFELTTETQDVVQAVHYCKLSLSRNNTRIYPDLLIVSQLAPNPYFLFFPLAALHLLPLSIHHTLACFALCHRIHQLPQESNRLAITENWTRVYHHRGMAIRELTESIGQDEIRCSDATITSVLMFLCMELQQSTSPNWQHHANGLTQLVNLRGGLGTVFRSAPNLRPALVLYLILAIYGNTTSPPSNQITVTTSLNQLLAQVTKMYGVIFPHILCPPSLFLDIINVNNLRLQSMSLPPDDRSIRSEAEELLARIEAFSPEDWAQPNASFHEEWLLIGTVYQSAVALYCISSLQSLSMLEPTPRLNAIRASHGDRLFFSLKPALASWQVKKFMMWPLVVSGVEAARYTIHIQTWVEKQLSEMSRDLGTSSPLEARAVLRRFWATQKTEWDECFDKPYAFFC